jgi:hypothetical protein
MTMVLPDIIELSDHEWNIDSYEAAIHVVYLDIFRNPPVYYNGKQILPIVFPKQYKGRHWTFSHMTSTGKVEDDREFDLRRCERLTWVKKILMNLDHPSIKKWRQIRRSKSRIAIWHETQDFLIILEERTDTFKLITIFLTQAQKYKNQFNKEYQEYIKELNAGKADPI